MNVINNKKALVIGGSGGIGQYVSKLLVSIDYEIHCLDRKPPNSDFNSEYYECDISSDNVEINYNYYGVIVLAIPYNITRQLIPDLFNSITKSNILIIDTFSVKYDYFSKLDGLTNLSKLKLNFLSINPLFNPVKMVEHPKVLVGSYDNFFPENILEAIALGSEVIVLDDMKKYDEIMATMQVAPHFLIIVLGTIIEKSGLNYEKFSHYSTAFVNTLKDSFVRLSKGMPHVYWEIQKYNPHAAKMRSKIRSLIDSLDKLVDSGDYQGFERLFVDMNNFFSHECVAIGSLMAHSEQTDLKDSSEFYKDEIDN